MVLTQFGLPQALFRPQRCPHDRTLDPRDQISGGDDKGAGDGWESGHSPHAVLIGLAVCLFVLPPLRRRQVPGASLPIAAPSQSEGRLALPDSSS